MNDMTLPHPVPSGDEALFGLQELFYSRTDPRGVIRTGNRVFQRVSGYDWERLAGAPHRIIRHPDMPRAVFHLLWKTIRRGDIIVAYVKNRTASGGHYWVLATVLPLPDGYLSIRIKPGSPVFAQARKLYADLRAEEIAEELSPEVSAGRLLARLRDLGFADYASFMLTALLQECAARNQAHSRINGAIFTDIDKAIAALSTLTEEQDRLVREFERLRDLPTNMRIIASRLEPSGGPVSAISETYKITLAALSSDISAIAVGEASLLNQMKASFSKALLLLSCARLQAEVVEQFQCEGPASQQFDQQAEEALLADLAAAYDLEARGALARAVQIAGALKGGCSDIRRSMLGLDTIRVMGRVESGRMGTAGTRLAATIDQLDLRHAVIIERLQSIMDLSTTINASISRIGCRYCAPTSGPAPP
jgi:PAS domain S-box-containing protein